MLPNLSNSPSYCAPMQKNAREVRRIKISVFVMALEDCPMSVLNLLLILMGCIDKSQENTETIGVDLIGNQSLDTLLVISTVFSAILFGYKGNKVLGFGRIEREAIAAEFEISQIEKKVTAMLEVWEGGGLEEENRRLMEVTQGQNRKINQLEAEIHQKKSVIDKQRADNLQLLIEVSTLRRRLVENGG